MEVHHHQKKDRVGGVIVLTVIAFAIWLFVEYTPFVVMGVLGLVGVWIGKKFESMRLAVILAIALGAVGFYLGTDWSVETDGINTSPQQIEDSQSIRETNPVEDSPSTFAPDPVENSESIPSLLGEIFIIFLVLIKHRLKIVPH